MKERILIIEDEVIIAEDIKNILEADDYYVCAIADSYDTALIEFKLHSPEIVITDIYLKGKKNGVDIANELIKLQPVPFVFITAYSNDELIETISVFPNITYITKPFSNSQVIAAVKMMSARLNNSNSLPKLSKREQQVLDLVIKGHSSTEIAKELDISFETVRTYRKKLLTKFKVKSAGQMVNIVLKTNPYKL
jgi:DNA-binding NarL/FixJ family response regulator